MSIILQFYKMHYNHQKKKRRGKEKVIGGSRQNPGGTKVIEKEKERRQREMGCILFQQPV